MQKDLELCMCGSTQPFSACCKSAISVDTRQNIIYPEKYIVDPLITGSTSFAQFYKTNRQNITKEILWFSDGEEGFSASDQETHYQIHISDPCECTLENYSIAHEMTHCLFYGQGFPLLKLRDRYLTNSYAVMMASAIQTMLHDLLVQSFLSEYGYRLRRLFIKEKDRERETMMQLSREPEDEFDKRTWKFNFASAILDWYQISPNSEPEYFAWYSTRYPNIAREGRIIANQVLSSAGYDTPQKMKDLLNAIVTSNQLTAYFNLL